MNPAVAERAGEIKALVCRVLEVSEDEVGDTDLFIDDLGADSRKLVGLLAHLEVEFDVEVDVDELEQLVHLRGVYALLSAAWQR